MTIQADYGSNTACHLLNEQVFETIRNIVNDLPSNLPDEQKLEQYRRNFYRFFEDTVKEIRKLAGSPSPSSEDMGTALKLLQHADGVLQALYLGNDILVGPSTGMYAGMKRDLITLEHIHTERPQNPGNSYHDSNEWNDLLEARYLCLSQSYINNDYLMSVKKSMPRELDAYTESAIWVEGMSQLGAFADLLQNDGWRLGQIWWDSLFSHTVYRTQEAQALGLLASSGIVLEDLPVGSQTYYQVSVSFTDDSLQNAAVRGLGPHNNTFERLSAICNSLTRLETAENTQERLYEAVKESCHSWNDSQFYALFNRIASLDVQQGAADVLAAEIIKRTTQTTRLMLGDYLGGLGECTEGLPIFTVPPVLSHMPDSADISEKVRILHTYAKVADILDQKGHPVLAHTVRSCFKSPMDMSNIHLGDTSVIKMTQSILYNTSQPNDSEHPVDKEWVAILEDVKIKYYQYDGLSLIYGANKPKVDDLNGMPHLDLRLVRFSADPVVEGAYLKILEAAPKWFWMDALYPYFAAHGCLNSDSLPLMGATERLSFFESERWRSSPHIAALVSHTDFSAITFRNITRLLNDRGLPMIRPGKEEQALMLLHDIITHCWITASSEYSAWEEDSKRLRVAKVNNEPDVTKPYFKQSLHAETSGNTTLPNTVSGTVAVAPASEDTHPDMLRIWRDNASVSRDYDFDDDTQESAFITEIHHRLTMLNKTFADVLQHLNIPSLAEKVETCLATLNAFPCESAMFENTVNPKDTVGIIRALPTDTVFFKAEGDMEVPNLIPRTYSVASLVANHPATAMYSSFKHADPWIYAARAETDVGKILPTFGGSTMASLCEEYHRMRTTAETMLSNEAELAESPETGTDFSIDFS